MSILEKKIEFGNIFKKDLAVIPFGMIALFGNFFDNPVIVLTLLALGVLGLIYQVMCLWKGK